MRTFPTRVRCFGGTSDRSRAPHHHPNAIGEEVEQELLKLKWKRPLWGAPKLRSELFKKVGKEKCPAESTISAILKRYGLSRVARPRRRSIRSEQPLGHCESVNEVWCADFKGWFRTGDDSKCTPLTISDAHSRYLIRCQDLGEKTGTLLVKPVFIGAFREYGMPQAIRTDNGTPFACCGLGGLTELAVWWIRLGLELERIEPGQPQQNGRHERMHRTLKEATASPPKRTLKEQQKAFDEFRTEYNEERPHEALGQRPPSSIYRRSMREYPERLPEQQGYPEDWAKRVVKKWGQIKWGGKEVTVSAALKGQEIGLKPVADGIWEIYFESCRLGIFNEQTEKVKAFKQLQIATNETAYNQDLPKVLPM